MAKKKQKDEKVEQSIKLLDKAISDLGKAKWYLRRGNMSMFSSLIINATLSAEESDKNLVIYNPPYGF